jgi:aromatic ring-cleaving dioxygenase
MKNWACLIDRDGTIARIDRTLVECENPDWAGFHAALPFDSPIPAVINMVRSINRSYYRIIMTGRSEDQRSQMVDWLFKHEVPFDLLLMRPSKDQRADHVVKEELYRAYVEPEYDVKYVIDDRPSVCDTWRKLGLPVVQVTQPEEIPPFEYLTKTERDK